jgi:capsular polysaccharide transport system permease protein
MTPTPDGLVEPAGTAPDTPPPPPPAPEAAAGPQTAEPAATAAPTSAPADAPSSGRGETGVSEDGFGDRVFPTAAPAPAPAPGDDGAEAEIAAIRAEGLTGRQLRMARRVAERHGIAAKSDHDAVRLLRKLGIDPFRHGNMLELVVGEANGMRRKAEAAGQVGAEAAPAAADPGALRTLPQTVPERARPALPSPDVSAEDRRVRELLKVQREIARRRKRKLAFLFLRLAAFVLLPTLITGYYFFNVATPMYATRSEMVIQQAQPQAAVGAGSLFAGSPLATAQDSITVQGYLQSREAMLRLDADHGFKRHFSDPAIDPIQRLEPDASNEDAYEVYRRNVKISYDPTEGIIKMEVIAADPEVSATFSRALISYAEEQVDQLTQRLREDQMAGAMENYAKAEENVRLAQQKVIELQERRGVFSAEAEASSLMGQISTLEKQLIEARLGLRELQENANPNPARVAQAERNIARLEGMIAELRRQMTEGSDTTISLARITGELMMAEHELQTRQILLSQSLEQLETARIEANRQVRYLSTGVSPVPPDRPTYPRALENTLVAGLIFLGIYLLASITVSILREQVSA